jgi:hypothetical protein
VGVASIDTSSPPAHATWSSFVSISKARPRGAQRAACDQRPLNGVDRREGAASAESYVHEACRVLDDAPRLVAVV